MKKFALLTAALVAPMLVMGQQADGGKDKDATIRAICILKPMSKSNVKGTIWFVQTGHKVMIKGEVTGLKEGKHGFHIHENPSCATKDKDGKPVAALGAGGHYDPAKTGKHGLPWGDGHLGDLPPIYVDKDGMAMNPVLGPRVKLADLAGHSLMIHAGGDNHSDHPMPLGGGGARIACGVVP